jgi:hypothetical protein
MAISSACSSESIPIDPVTGEGKQCVEDAKMDLRACEGLVRQEATDCVERERARAEIPYQRALERYEDEVRTGLIRHQQAMENYYRIEELRRQCEARNEQRAYEWDSGQTDVVPRYEDCPRGFLYPPPEEEFIPEKPTLRDFEAPCYYRHEEAAACGQVYRDYYKKCGGRYEIRESFLGIETSRRIVE